jgi:type II secretory pathway component GspD/PulD (secretin)
VDISTDDLRQLGLNWGLTAVPIIQITGTSTPENPPGTLAGRIVFGVADFVIQAKINAMVTANKARVISAPRVAVIDGNDANINLGQDVPIPSIDAAGRLTFTFKPVGVILHIVPKVNRDGLITTKIEPEVSSVIRFLDTSSGPVPLIATRKASTTMTVPNGSSIVLGGLISSEERRTEIKVPLLGDIPLIGALFRTTNISHAESEVIFVITVQILQTPAAAPTPAPAPTSRP